jgi:hypothetical protein
MLWAVMPTLGLAALAANAQADEVVAEVEIRRVAVSDDGVLRMKATYFCPDGWRTFDEPERIGTVAQAYQQLPDRSLTLFNWKKFRVTCDGTEHLLRVRFATSDFGPWQKGGILTSVGVDFNVFLFDEAGEFTAEARAADWEAVIV